MIEKYIKKQDPIEAVQWTGNYKEICEFVRRETLETDSEVLFKDGTPGCILIPTRKGGAWAYPYDYIIKRSGGEIFFCTQSVFEQLYTKVSPSYKIVED